MHRNVYIHIILDAIRVSQNDEFSLLSRGIFCLGKYMIMHLTSQKGQMHKHIFPQASITRPEVIKLEFILKLKNKRND